MCTWLASIRCMTCCNRYSSVSTNQKQERHSSSLIAAFKNMSPLLLLPGSVLSHFQSASWNQITLKMSENWAGNATTPLENKGLCFIGCSRGACEHYVWCLKYCSWQKKTYWLSSGSQIFFYLDFLGQSSKWEGQLLGSEKYNLILSMYSLPSLFSLSYWIQEGAIRRQIKFKKTLQFGTALSSVSDFILWQGAAIWLKVIQLCDWLMAISWHLHSHTLSGSSVIVCPLPLDQEKNCQKMESKTQWCHPM